MVRTPYRVRRHEDGPFAGRVEHYFPDADERGLHVFGDPALGGEKHRAKNAFFTDNIQTALHLVRTYGFSIRMRGDLTKQWNLIRRDEIQGL